MYMSLCAAQINHDLIALAQDYLLIHCWSTYEIDEWF